MIIIRDGPWSGPSLLLTCSKKRGWPAFDPTLKRFFLTWREKDWKFDILRGNFPNPNHRWLTWPKPQKIAWPRSKIFDPDPSLMIMSMVTGVEMGPDLNVPAFDSDIIWPDPMRFLGEIFQTCGYFQCNVSLEERFLALDLRDEGSNPNQWPWTAAK